MSAERDAFARTGKAGDDGQGVAWDFEADIFQIMLPRAPNNQFGQAHMRLDAPSTGAPAHSG